jgi:hypothetical protein
MSTRPHSVQFRTIFLLVRTLFESLVQRLSAADPGGAAPLRTVCLIIECLTSLIALSYTVHAAPERITPRQLLRLSKAARALTRLTGQTFDFTPWTSLTPEELDRISPIPEPNPLTPYRIRIPEYRLPASGFTSPQLCQHPGATLANVIKKLVRILPPDFSPNLSPSPSQSPSQSALELESQSRSQSQSILSISSTGSIGSTPSIPSIPSILPGPSITPSSSFRLPPLLRPPP